MPVDKPILLYDGDCRFCCRWIKRWKKMTGDRVSYAPYQDVLEVFPEVTEQECAKSVQLIEVDSKVYSAAEAVLRISRNVDGFGWMYKLYRKSPVFAKLSEKTYKFVARNRTTLSRFGL